MASERDEDRLVSLLELARQVLDLEQQLDAYQALYEEEIGQIRNSFAEIRKELLVALSTGTSESAANAAEGDESD